MNSVLRLLILILNLPLTNDGVMLHALEGVSD